MILGQGLVWSVNEPTVILAEHCRAKYADNFARRIGDAIYYNALNVYGRIVKVNYVYQSEYIGYDCGYQMPYDGYVGVIDIGYADGLARKCDGFTVYINNKYYYLDKTKWAS